jgi:hypothetical protein
MSELHPAGFQYRLTRLPFWEELIMSQGGLGKLPKCLMTLVSALEVDGHCCPQLNFAHGFTAEVQNTAGAEKSI